MSEFDLNASIEEQKVMDFFIAVLQDEALRDQLMAALDAKDNAAILGMASAHGYKLIQESMHQGLKNITNFIAPIVLAEN